jgi:hypothetical protein
MKKLAMFLTAAALTIFTANTAQAQEVAKGSIAYSGSSGKYHNAHNKHYNNYYKKVCNYNHYEVYCEGGNPFLLKHGQKYFSHNQWRCDYKTYYKFELDGCCFYVCYDSRHNNWSTSNQCPKGYGGR